MCIPLTCPHLYHIFPHLYTGRPSCSYLPYPGTGRCLYTGRHHATAAADHPVGNNHPGYEASLLSECHSVTCHHATSHPACALRVTGPPVACHHAACSRAIVPRVAYPPVVYHRRANRSTPCRRREVASDPPYAACLPPVRSSRPVFLCHPCAGVVTVHLSLRFFFPVSLGCPSSVLGSLVTAIVLVTGEADPGLMHKDLRERL